jgi:hypothetical protein
VIQNVEPEKECARTVESEEECAPTVDSEEECAPTVKSPVCVATSSAPSVKPAVCGGGGGGAGTLHAHCLKS